MVPMLISTLPNASRLIRSKLLLLLLCSGITSSTLHLFRSVVHSWTSYLLLWQAISWCIFGRGIAWKMNRPLCLHETFVSQNTCSRNDWSTCENDVRNYSIHADRKNVLLGSCVQSKDSRLTKVNGSIEWLLRLKSVFRRKEIIRHIYRAIVESIQIISSLSYLYVVFLITYTILWFIDMRFDARFFAVACCMLHHLEITVMEMIFAVRDLVHYITAEKRLRVNFHRHRSFPPIVNIFRLKRNFYWWMKQNETNDCYHRHRHRRASNGASHPPRFTAI